MIIIAEIHQLLDIEKRQESSTRGAHRQNSTETSKRMD